jgi:hypothetical protein
MTSLLLGASAAEDMYMYAPFCSRTGARRFRRRTFARFRCDAIASSSRCTINDGSVAVPLRITCTLWEHTSWASSLGFRF